MDGTCDAIQNHTGLRGVSTTRQSWTGRPLPTSRRVCARSAAPTRLIALVRRVAFFRGLPAESRIAPDICPQTLRRELRLAELSRLMSGGRSPAHASAPNGDDRPVPTVGGAARYLEGIPGRLCRGRQFCARVIPSIQEHIEIQLCQARCSHLHRHNARFRAQVRTTRDAGGSRLWARFPC